MGDPAMKRKKKQNAELRNLAEDLTDEKLESVKGGATVRPETDDEVLVSFEHGEVKSPYIIGGLWSGKSKP